MNLLEQQASNRRRTWLVVAAFIVFLVALGFGFDQFYLGLGAPFPIGSVFALGIGSVSALTGYYRGDRAVLLSTGAVPLEQLQAAAASDDQRFKLKQLDDVVEEVAIAAGLPKPKVYLVPDSDPNAFATGRDPQHASIAVTRGLLDLVTREELQGVVAHEMSHIRNLDVRLLTLIAALVGAIVLMADWTTRGMRYGVGGNVGGGRKKGSGGALVLVLFLLWLVAMILAPFVARILAMMVSRRREYLADASGAELTRNPGALAVALTKIDAAAEPTRAVKQGSAHLCIADPLGRAVGIREGFWPDLLATHPPMKNRIAALRQMAYQS